MLSESCSAEWPKDNHKSVLCFLSCYILIFRSISFRCYCLEGIIMFMRTTAFPTLSFWCKMSFFVPQTGYRGEDDWSREQLCRQIESQLKAELEESQKQLKCAHDIQQEQRNKMQSLRYKNTNQHSSTPIFSFISSNGTSQNGLILS